MLSHRKRPATPPGGLRGKPPRISIPGTPRGPGGLGRPPCGSRFPFPRGVRDPCRCDSIDGAPLPAEETGNAIVWVPSVRFGPLEAPSDAVIVLFTDFGREGPYTGQMTAVLRRLAPEVEIIDLIADAPAHDPQLAAYFLAAYVDEFPPQTVFLCVVDPGVGGDRSPGVLQADGRWFVGPDNGLFEPIIRRCRDDARWRDILWRPSTLSATFHGRDLFAPVAARLARGLPVPWRARSIVDVRATSMARRPAPGGLYRWVRKRHDRYSRLEIGPRCHRARRRARCAPGQGFLRGFPPSGVLV